MDDPDLAAESEDSDDDAASGDLDGEHLRTPEARDLEPCTQPKLCKLVFAGPAG